MTPVHLAIASILLEAGCAAVLHTGLVCLPLLAPSIQNSDPSGQYPLRAMDGDRGFQGMKGKRSRKAIAMSNEQADARPSKGERVHVR